MKFLNEHKKWFVWFVVIGCIIAMVFTISFRYVPGFGNRALSIFVVGPQKAIDSVENWFSNKTIKNTDINVLTAQNAVLQSQNDTLKIENDRLKLLEDENKKLTALLGTSESFPDYPKVTANIIAKDPSNWYDTFVIDKGTNDGVEKNMVVIATDGLVGKIAEAGATHSKVVSIIDDTSSVSGIVTRNDSLGFVRGDSSIRNQGLLQMDYFDINAEVMVGDEVTTSHLSDIYPKGIPIGTVNEVFTDPTGISKSATIKPFVNFNDLQTVIVITQDFSKDISDLKTTSSAASNN